jgi:acyl-CoA dehydrogenase
MDFEFSDKVKGLGRRLQAFLDEHIYPNEQRFRDEIDQNRWLPTSNALCNSPVPPRERIARDS